jgi:hypothetical protein
MPLTILPLDLPGEVMTQIMEETVREILQELEEGARQIYNDGVFPGTKPLSAPERLGFYLENTDFADYELLFDDNYIEALMQLGPEAIGASIASPYWLNQMSIRGSFERNRKDFMRLVNQEQGRRERFREVR